jgi:hypothetical protein
VGGHSGLQMLTAIFTCLLKKYKTREEKLKVQKPTINYYAAVNLKKT